MAIEANREACEPYKLGQKFFQLQPGWTMSDSIDSPMTLTATYTGDKDYFLSNSSGSIRQDIESFPDAVIRVRYGLRLESWSAVFDEQLVSVTANYTGSEFSTDSDSDDRATYNWIAGVGEKAIELHPNFIDIGGTPEIPKNGALWKNAKTNDISINGKNAYFDRFAQYDKEGEFVRGNLAGLESYLTLDGARWEVNRQRNEEPNSDGVGEIASRVPGDPSTPSGYSWLKIGASYRKVGRGWEITEQYQLGEWDPKIYKTF